MLPALRPSFLLAVLLAPCLVACGGEPEAVTGEEQEIKEGVQARGYPEAVVINSMSADLPTAACSGVLLSPRVVLTAAHCVDGYRGFGVVAPYAEGQYAVSYESALFDWTSGGKYSATEHDVALVFLPSDIVIDAYPTRKREGLASGTTVVTVGRVNNGFIADEALFLSQPFAVYPNIVLGGTQHRNVYAAIYSTIQRGDSGGPAYLPDTHELIGVNSTTQFIARLDGVNDWIDEQIAAHPASDEPTE